MALLLLQNAEDAAGSCMALGTGTHARAADHDPVAINMHFLLRNADQDHKGTLGRNFRMPPVLARFKRSRRLTGRCAFCVKRRSVHRLRGGASETLRSALYASRRKIPVFLSFVLAVVLIMGTVMYLIEGEENGFNSIPRGVYWAIVTLTTVGYGDVTPHTVLGRVLACFIMIMGYGIIAVPTGIFSVELHQAVQAKEARTCGNCQTTEADRKARFCRRCGKPLE